MSIYIWDKEIKNLYVWESISISDMQWPCPDGFHVPLRSEWAALCWILTTTFSMANNATTMGTYLKMPMGGSRLAKNASVSSIGASGGYWASDAAGTDYSGDLVFNSSGIYTQNAIRSTGYSVRWFKNSPTVPTSSWTTLYQGTWNAWVFWNSTDWLISVSGDGTTWYTIQDKNLWATTVFNQGDTETDANCGYFYQWGNNYGFAHSWTVTTSSTQVDASNYWPWNYYSSSTFIKRSYSPYDRSSVKTDNLWWWVTQKTEEKWAVKAVYLWENKVRPSADTRTFTISRTEKSNMSSWWTYSDDAAWLTAWDTAFDEFFWYYGCRLNASGVETAKITQEESWWAWKLDITQLWTLTSGDNVMIAFPVMWIKMSKSWSTVTLSITKELNKSWYQYYAHSAWTLSNPWTPQDVFYLGAYKWYSSSSVIKSWSGQSPTVSQTQSKFITRAKANGSGYNIIGFYQRMFVNCLYMMKYWNPDCQSVIWRWYTGWSAKVNTGWTNSQTNATYGTTSTKVQAKLFWLEDWWGNISEFLWGACTDGSKNLWTALSWFTWAITTSSPYENTGTTIQSTSTYRNLSSILWSNKWLFAPTATVNNTSYNTYYCDYALVNASCLAYAGGDFNDSSNAGALHLILNLSASNTNSYVGSRLMYLNWLT